MPTKHQIFNINSRDINFIPDNSIDLVITSPPYPMIEMWDDLFFDQNKKAKEKYNNSDFSGSFTEMHSVLNGVWQELDRVLKKNGFICINIGDATRNCSGVFRLFSNHAKVISFFDNLGYSVLPDIIWRKQTNAPTKFLGSGMLPPGAYVTYEHEYILVFRKGGKREFISEDEKHLRRESAYFWEERNEWFSDLWHIKGVPQSMNNNNGRKRSAAFPFSLPYRLVNMFSIKGDVILDPFAGIGTTSLASMASERNSISIDIDNTLCKYMKESLLNSQEEINEFIQNRINAHLDFIFTENLNGKNFAYKNIKTPCGLPKVPQVLVFHK